MPGWKRSGASTLRDRIALIEDVEFLRDTGYRQATPAQLGDRLGRSKESISRAIQRHQQAQRLAANAEPTDPCPDDLEASA